MGAREIKQKPQNYNLVTSKKKGLLQLFVTAFHTHHGKTGKQCRRLAGRL